MNLEDICLVLRLFKSCVGNLVQCSEFCFDGWIQIFGGSVQVYNFFKVDAEDFACFDAGLEVDFQKVTERGSV